VGKSESGERGFNWIEAGQAHNIRSRQEEDRSRTASEVGEGEGAAEEGGLVRAKGACCEKCGGLIVVDCSPTKLDSFAERSSQIENRAKRERRRSRSPEIIGGMK
jgi:hypothetical protein